MGSAADGVAADISGAAQPIRWKGLQVLGYVRRSEAYLARLTGLPRVRTGSDLRNSAPNWPPP